MPALKMPDGAPTRKGVPSASMKRRVIKRARLRGDLGLGIMRECLAWYRPTASSPVGGPYVAWVPGSHAGRHD